MSRRCPQCGKPLTSPDAKPPFCSLRCADLDLARWFNESYRIPAEAVDDEKQEKSDENI